MTASLLAKRIRRELPCGDVRVQRAEGEASDGVAVGASEPRESSCPLDSDDDLDSAPPATSLTLHDPPCARNHSGSSTAAIGMLRHSATGALCSWRAGRLCAAAAYSSLTAGPLIGAPRSLGCLREASRLTSMNSSGSRHAASCSSSAEQVAQTTIFALATPPGKAGVAVFRVSGPAVQDVFDAMIFPHGSFPEPGSRRKRPPSARRMVMRDIRVPAANGSKTPGEVIDEGLVVYFEGPPARPRLPHFCPPTDAARVDSRQVVHE